MRSANEVLHTDGSGLWSREVKEVQITGLAVSVFCEDKEPDYGELRVYFDGRSWNPEQHGLIYTDKQFLVELKDYLTRAQYDATDVSYHEQVIALQGDDYVSLDVGPKFLQSWKVSP